LKKLLVILFALTPFLWISAAVPQSKSAKKPTRPKPADESVAVPAEAINPAVFLMRDPVVQNELQLSGTQKQAVGELALAVNDSLFKMRDLAPEAGIGSDGVKPFNEAFEAKLAPILSAIQQERIDQIGLHVQGRAAFARDKVAERLGLSADQRRSVAKLVGSVQAAFKDLRTQAAAGKNLSDLNRQVKKLNGELQQDLSALLTPEQRSRWEVLVGKPFDIAKLQPSCPLAPDLRDITAWINSEPFTLADMRGKVVALHFWTFG
jgi:hypothetical protein